jgi:hypothetical protein
LRGAEGDDVTPTALALSWRVRGDADSAAARALWPGFVLASAAPPAILLLNGLAAYSIGRVPVPWLAAPLALASAAALILWEGRLRPVPGLSQLGIWLLWMLTVTLVSAVVVDYESLMPPGPRRGTPRSSICGS